MDEAGFHELFLLGEDSTPYRKLTADYVATASFEGQRIVKVAPEALTLLARDAFINCQHLLRPGHLEQWRAILNDPEASANDRFVAFDLLKNANIAAGKVLPMCQDTGTAIVMGKKGQRVWTGADDAAALSEGIRRTFTETNLRYSQVAPLSMYEEVNTGDNLPAQIDLYAEPGEEYKFLFIAKGGGSANKSFLYQQSKAVLNPKSLLKFIDEKIRTLGTAACPPYHLSIVIGGTSAEMTLKTVKLASCRYLDSLPTSGNKYGQAYRDRDFEAEVLELTRHLGIGAQFGGKYFCHDVRVIRLPRHGASLPIGIGVSCSADRQILGKITADGVFLEELEINPARFLPEIEAGSLGGDVAAIDLGRPTSGLRQTPARYPVKTRLSLTGPLIVARDIAHAKLQERLDRGEGLPQYIKDHPIYYAGPAKTPAGYASGSFGPTTAGRMDSYVDQLMAAGGGVFNLPQGKCGAEGRHGCKKNSGFYLGSVGGPAGPAPPDRPPNSSGIRHTPARLDGSSTHR